MERTPHVMLVGEGAALFAQDQGLEPIADEAAWYHPAPVRARTIIRPEP